MNFYEFIQDLNRRWQRLCWVMLLVGLAFGFTLGFLLH